MKTLGNRGFVMPVAIAIVNCNECIFTTLYKVSRFFKPFIRARKKVSSI